MPAGATIIGRVGVKVLPDTTDFRKDAERQLNAVEKKLKISIPTKLDMSGAQRDFITELQKINQRNRNNDNRKIRFHATISRDGMREAVVSARRRLQELAQSERIQFNIDDLNATTMGRLRIDQDSLEDAKKELERWRRNVSPIKVLVEATVSKGSAAIAAAQLSFLSRPRTVPLLPKVDSKAALAAGTALAALSGARVVHKYFDDITDSLKNLDKNLPVIGALSLAISGLVGWTLAGASNLLALTYSLAQIGPAALALPGILGGLTLGIGTMVAALRDFHTIFPDVKKSLSEMQDSISENFWARARAPMREMIDTLLPQLAAGLNATASSLGTFFADLTSSLTETFSGALAGMFDDLAASIEIAATGTDAYAGVIRTLGEVGAGYLPRLAQWFVDISTSFDNFLSQAAADGRLQQWIDNGIFQLGELGRVVSGFWGVFSGLARGAIQAGGSTLTILADTLQRMSDTVNSADFQTRLVNVLEAAHLAMSNISAVSGPAVNLAFKVLADTAAHLLPIVGEAIGGLLTLIANIAAHPAVQGGLVTFFMGLRDAISSLQPLGEPIGLALGAILDVLGLLAETVAPLAVSVFETFAQVLVDLQPTIEWLISNLGPPLVKVIDGVGAAILAVTGYLSDHQTTAQIVFSAVIAGFAAWGVAATVNAAKNVAAWVSTALAAVASGNTQKLTAGQLVAMWVLMAAKAAFNAAKIVASWLLTAVAGAAKAAVSIATSVAKMVASWVLLAAQAAANAAKVVASWVLTSAAALKAVAIHAAQVAVMVAKWVFLGAQALINGAKVAAAWLLALGPIGIVIAAVAAAVVLIIVYWDDIKAAFQRGVAAVTGFVQALPGKIKGFFSNAGSILVNAGREIIEGLLRGITGAFGKVKAKLGELTSMLPDWKGPANRDRTILRDAGRLVIGGFIDGLESQYGAVRRSLTGLTRDVQSTSFAAPSMALNPGAVRAMGSLIGDVSNGGTVIQKTLNYHAAPGSSISSEEDLFAAASRTRMVGW